MLRGTWYTPFSERGFLLFIALTLHHEGKVRLPGDLTGWVAHATAGTKEAPFTHDVALARRQIPFDLDPTDRILSATALVFDLTLVTADERLLGLGNIRTLTNR
jgi:PIN domain nuclease of toxin-antitoxin system